jgi:hypothetical protein
MDLMLKKKEERASLIAKNVDQSGLATEMTTCTHARCHGQANPMIL